MNQIKIQKHLELFSEAAPQEELDLLARHNLYFETRAASTPALVNAVHALRYQVYCLERKFEKTEEHAGGMEVDAYDSHSAHGLLIYRLTDEALGTVRIISPNHGSVQNDLPIVNILRDSNINLADYLPIDRTVEISRFAISKQLRRRLADQYNSLENAALRSSRRTGTPGQSAMPQSDAIYCAPESRTWRHTLGCRDGSQIASNVCQHGHSLSVNWAGGFAPWSKAALLWRHFGSAEQY